MAPPGSQGRAARQGMGPKALRVHGLHWPRDRSGARVLAQLAGRRRRRAVRGRLRGAQRELPRPPSGAARTRCRAARCGSQAAPAAPLLVFVHGGYWQALSAAASLYLAPGALAHGWSFAAVEYTLAPAGDLPTMVRRVRARRSRAGSPPGRAGAGGAGRAFRRSAPGGDGVARRSSPPLPIDRTVLVSGVFDLRPLVHTTVNEPLGLDERPPRRVQPAAAAGRRRRVARPDVIVAWGDNETDAFKSPEPRLRRPPRAQHGSQVSIVRVRRAPSLRHRRRPRRPEHAAGRAHPGRS